MRTRGTLIKWNDDRGFGFVSLPGSREEVFVHISAFPRDGARPRIGEIISFEVRITPDGRKRAEAIERPRGDSARHKGSARVRRRRSVDWLFTGAAVLVLGVVGYNSYSPRHEASSLISPALETTGQSFKCDGRTHCSQMTSCAEARYFLKYCPGVQMDGNGDGKPCEQQWCN